MWSSEERKGAEEIKKFLEDKRKAEEAQNKKATEDFRNKYSNKSFKSH